jgi:hypothetical protein
MNSGTCVSREGQHAARIGLRQVREILKMHDAVSAREEAHRISVLQEVTVRMRGPGTVGINYVIDDSSL